MEQQLGLCERYRNAERGHFWSWRSCCRSSKEPSCQDAAQRVSWLAVSCQRSCHNSSTRVCHRGPFQSASRSQHWHLKWTVLKSRHGPRRQNFILVHQVIVLGQGISGLEVLVANGARKVHVEMHLNVPPHLGPITHPLATTLALVLVRKSIFNPLYQCLQSQI